MLPKIQPPNPNILSAVEYNEKKTRGGRAVRDHEMEEDLLPIEDGSVLATRNVPEDSTLVSEFEKLRIIHIKKGTGRKFKNSTFHISINPSETDTPLSDERAVELIDEVMESLGYANQPYRIYKHTDIERLHYHVVSCRSDYNGKKINDSYERLVLRSTMKRLAPKYGFMLVLNEQEKEALRQETVMQEQEAIENAPSVQNIKKTENSSNAEEKVNDTNQGEPQKTKAAPVPPFTRKPGVSVKQQITAAFEDAMRWHFSTFEQVQALMLRRYNVLMEVERIADGQDEKVKVSGTDADGQPITPFMNETELGVIMLRRIREKCARENMYIRKDQRKRLVMLARAAADRAQSWSEFRELMERKGTYVVLSWTKEGEPFGVTYLDRATRCAWKGSETLADFKWLKETAESKGWTMEKDKYQTVIHKRGGMPSRKRTISAVHPEVGSDTRPTQHRNGRGSLDAMLSAIRPGGHHQDGASHIARTKGDIWDDAMVAAEREEAERKRAEHNQSM